jgi:hypothetical protein
MRVIPPEVTTKVDKMVKKIRLPKDETPHTRADNETIQLSEIHHALNNCTRSGLKIIIALMSTFSDIQVFVGSVISGGNRSIHHDFKIKLIYNNGTEMIKTVEFKGSKHNKKIDYSKTPWIYAVQFYNGPGDKFSVGTLYARQFYDTMLDDIIRYYAISAPKPTYEEWAKDAFAQRTPKTLFVTELREKGYINHQTDNYLSECRKTFNKRFILNAEQLDVLKKEVYAISNEVLSSKDFWLQINGPIHSPEEFDVKWTGKLEMSPIIQVEQIFSNTGCDVNFIFICEDTRRFKAKLRWGYGQCITNLRVDIS